MRNISFAYTIRQFKARTKTQTRRLGWASVRVGDELMACEKCQGLKPGETLVRLGRIRVTAVRREALNQITAADVVREGFPELNPAQFVAMFCLHMGTTPETIVTVIDFEYLDPEESRAHDCNRSTADPARNLAAAAPGDPLPGPVAAADPGPLAREPAGLGHRRRADRLDQR